jgi:hypothetical protein
MMDRTAVLTHVAIIWIFNLAMMYGLITTWADMKAIGVLTMMDSGFTIRYPFERRTVAQGVCGPDNPRLSVGAKEQ